MSPDFYASYLSGALGIIIGNPLDLLKVRLQNTPTLSVPLSSASTTLSSPNTATPFKPLTLSTYTSQFSSPGILIRGTTAPILGYGALNAILFMTYNRTASFIHSYSSPPTALGSSSVLGTNEFDDSTATHGLLTIWIAGAIGGLATWVISTPTELIKCRAQVANTGTSSPTSTISATTTGSSSSSYHITKNIISSAGIQGLYTGGVVTALRDSIGYGFYFWSYELSTRYLKSYNGVSNNHPGDGGDSTGMSEAVQVLLCGGLAGVVTWASIFPLDVIKTRVQTQTSLFSPLPTQHLPLPVLSPSSLPPSTPPYTLNQSTPLITTTAAQSQKSQGAYAIAVQAFRTEGLSVYWRGFGICSVRAFIVNAAQWAIYEWMVRELSPAKDTTTRSGVEVIGRG